MTPPTSESTAASGSRSRLHVVALAHLDTQWRWSERETAERYLPETVAANEPLFERRPRFVLSFEGAYRYRLLQRLHPASFARLAARVAEGRWHVAGAAVEAFDTLLPHPESILRQIHYGQRWFAHTLGRESVDLFLPDCFGFPATLPTLAAHAGLAGFSTQKLRRGALLRAARPIPFPYGRWRGPDGAELLAVLDPGEYSGRIEGDLTRDTEWLERFAALERAGRPRRLMTYVGIGDRGGAPPEPTIAALERALDGDGPIEVRHGGSERIFLETTADERAALPVHDGELLLREHATGCYSSKLALKRWNRANERLARAAEAAATIAAHLGRRYPAQRFEEAWWRILAHQMHDDLTGTSIPAAYRISLGDEALAGNELAELLTDAVAHVARALDRSGPGVPIVLFNPIGAAREDLVEIPWEGAPGSEPRLVSAEGRPLPAQVGRDRSGRRTLIFPASLPPFGFAVVARVDGEPVPRERGVQASADALENDRLRAGFDRQGRLASLLDRRSGRQLLAAPVELARFDDRSAKYPAWEIHWRDLADGPVATGAALLRSEIVEQGPLRSTLAIERAGDGFRVREHWSLAAGEAGGRLECAVELDALAPRRLLKCSFRFTVERADAAYDSGLGPVRRPLADASLYEVPAHGWAALDDAGSGSGVAVLSDTLAGWDHPDPATLRSTWLHLPRASLKWRHQRTQDLGRHRFRFALAPFGGRAEGGAPAAAAERFAAPILAFAATPGAGTTGCSFGLLDLGSTPVAVQALKIADDSPARTVVRLANRTGAPVATELTLSTTLLAAERLDGRERPTAPLDTGTLGVDVAPGGVATLGLDLAPYPAPPPAIAFVAVDGPRDAAVTLGRGETGDAGFDGRGRHLPRELLPGRLDGASVPFDLAHLGSGREAFVLDGQSLTLPAGTAELWLLAASADGAVDIDFELSGRVHRRRFPGWREPLYVESRRRFGRGIVDEQVRRAPVAFVAPFLRDARGRDLVVERALLGAVAVPVDGECEIVLPVAPRIVVLALTAASAPARPVEPLGLALL